ncbi:hypothetical protein CB0940_04522 [Cercospora beticola]|uniref:Thioredoxin-like fold domain-containing protein n=1 Tax=Cercospora beticola TaxID=122368 RepID=A0A2G5HJ05_CERBT|nr:hypothetical protein CB0940_04522 [Cercospora beticola]PIA92541.1 hypothetical protein CB0940_04522 [Cercospora beticola]WPB01768.1 hypothetical protein RHO25_006400 [Cercospora beticola]CAK1363407.1 unnamed protein product [Cercospora beticola]
MALAPKFAGQKFVAKASPETLHTLELYLDYVCPFSKKQFDTIYDQVFPLIKQKYPDKIQFIFRQQIQPWHPSSTLVHEAGVAVLQTAPNKFWDFSKALFAAQTEYFDANVVNEKRNDTYKRLAKLAGTVGIDEKDIYSRLEISDKPDKDGGLNGGNQVTNDIKLLVKANRLQGIHVTPTVMFNGYPENGISSSFSKDDWEKWLEKNIV